MYYFQLDLDKVEYPEYLPKVEDAKIFVAYLWLHLVLIPLTTLSSYVPQKEFFDKKELHIQGVSLILTLLKCKISGQKISNFFQTKLFFMVKLWKISFYKLSTFTKTIISPKLINIFKFGFDHTKSPEIYYEKQLSLKKIEIFWPEILHFKRVKMSETPCISAWDYDYLRIATTIL